MEQETDYGTASAETILKANSEFNRFGLYAVILLVVGCTGGLAVGVGAVNSTFALICLVIPTMTSLSLLLGLAPMKLLLRVSVIATIINLLFIAYYLIA